MPAIPYPLHTERLTLRRYVPEDLAAYHAYQSLPETA
ncbi:GNAT family N-acetyltransferase [Renibacterium salmoninarum]|nr:GNAT family N-acetyltransferase [Renibacterium salmoninarum]